MPCHADTLAQWMSRLLRKDAGPAANIPESFAPLCAAVSACIVLRTHARIQTDEGFGGACVSVYYRGERIAHVSDSSSSYARARALCAALEHLHSIGE